jgi:hypothetical protein
LFIRDAEPRGGEVMIHGRNQPIIRRNRGQILGVR